MQKNKMVLSIQLPYSCGEREKHGGIFFSFIVNRSHSWQSITSFVNMMDY